MYKNPADRLRANLFYSLHHLKSGDYVRLSLYFHPTRSEALLKTVEEWKKNMVNGHTGQGPGFSRK